VKNLPLNDSSPPTKLDGDDHPLWKRLMHGRGKDPIDAKTASAKKRPEVVDINAVRGFQASFSSTFYILRFLQEMELTEICRHEAHTKDKVICRNVQCRSFCGTHKRFVSDGTAIITSGLLAGRAVITIPSYG
jgi:hypothetical protein